MPEKATVVGENIEVTVNDNKLTIEVDLAQDFGRPEGKAMNRIASTGGFIVIPGTDGVRMQVFVGRK